jgi:hypothetical protein
VLLRLSFRGVSTAESREDLFQRGRGGVLYTVRGVSVVGEGHPDIGVPWYLLSG